MRIYFSMQRRVSCNLNNCTISCLFKELVLRLKKIKVLFRFNFCYKATSYFSKIFINHSHSNEFALQNKRLSSAKKMWLILSLFLEVGTPVRLPELSTWSRRALSAFAQRIKKYGANGSPWRVPHVGWIWPPRLTIDHHYIRDWLDTSHYQRYTSGRETPFSSSLLPKNFTPVNHKPCSYLAWCPWIPPYSTFKYELCEGSLRLLIHYQWLICREWRHFGFVI